MRLHAKRPIAALIVAVVAAMALSASASATPPKFEGTFSCAKDFAGNAQTCGGTTEWEPGRLAVNEETGDVYVFDYKPADKAIRVFDSDGDYKATISGTDVGGFPIGFEGEDIAIDNSGGPNKGRVYVSSGFSKFFAFDSSAAAEPHKPLWQTSSGEFCGAAVDAGGDLFAGIYGVGVQQLSTADGSAVGSPIVSAADVSDTCSIAFDSKDDLYMRSWDVPNLYKFLAPTYSFPGTQLPNFQHSDVEVNRSIDRAYSISSSLLLRWYESDGSQPADSGIDSEASGHTYLGVVPNSKTFRVYVSDTGNDAIEVWDPPQVKLEVFPSGSGSGTVECDAGSGPEACAATYVEGTKLTVTATPDPDSDLADFEGGGSASACTASPCTFTLLAETQVFAVFNLKRELTVKKAGTGSGTVKCDGGACAAEYEQGEEVTLEATADSGSTFSGWNGENCSGTGTCKLKMTVDRTVTATFTLNQSGGGGGTGGGGGSGGGGGTPPPPPPPPPVDKLGPCIAKANKAAQRAKKAAKKKKGKAKALAIKAANKRKAKAIKACKAQFG